MTTKELVNKWYKRHLNDLNIKREELLKLRTDVPFDGKLDFKHNPKNIIPVENCAMCGSKFLRLSVIGAVSKKVIYCGCLPSSLENKRRWIQDHSEEITVSMIKKIITKRKLKKDGTPKRVRRYWKKPNRDYEL